MVAEAPSGVLDVLSERFRKRFYSRVKISDGCWIWLGQRTKKGYGRISVRKRVFRAHRVAWELANGTVPPDRWVLHRCHNRACVRVDHLYLGTAADNARDKYEAGRANHATKAKGNWRGGSARKAGLARHGVLAALLIASLIPVTATANHWSGWTPYEKHYLSVYVHCWKAFEADCGRNIVDDNLASGKKPSRAQVVASSERMTRWLNPPKPASVAVAPTVSAPTPTTTSVPSGGSGCSGMSAESGSAGYGAYNPSSGAAGCYQIIPSTAAAHGCDLSTPGGQDACAQAICATEGPGAWASSGANPC